MVKCLIRIKTKVNVHLRMINHCYRDVKVRVLTMGPRLLGNVLGALPIIPSLPDSSSSGISISQYGRTSRAATESLHDSGVSTLMHSTSVSQSDSLASSLCYGSAHNDLAKISDKSHGQAVKNAKLHGKHEIQLESLKSEKVAGKTRGKATEPEGGTQQKQGGTVLRSVAWLVLALFALLSALLLLLFALTESKLEVGFLENVREHPEYQELHYTYFCPLRRWLMCTLRWMGSHLIKD